MKYFIVDYLGVHCGMHYYNNAFKSILSELIKVDDITILSNYSETERKAFFFNFYKVNKILGVLLLFCNYVRLLCKVNSNKNDCFIYLTYGNSIDIPFIWIISKASKYIIDIHEVIGQDVDANTRLKKGFKKIYSSNIKNVIVHSKRTNDFLDEYDFKGTRLFVPHFKYCFKKDYKINNITRTVENVISDSKINILFFGNINYNKGVDILISSINEMSKEQAEKLNIIIAGKDFDGTIHKVEPTHKEMFNIILKHINDDELVYLYEQVDYVVLPYRKTSQSGILEMSFYFKKPIIASNIPYFNAMLSEFPSFGVLSGIEIQSFAETIRKVVERHNKQIYYTDEEYNKYSQRKEIKTFISSFSAWLDKR